MEWKFNCEFISESVALIKVFYLDNELLVIDSSSEDINFHDMDMLDIEEYLIENYGDELEFLIYSLKN